MYRAHSAEDLHKKWRVNLGYIAMLPIAVRGHIYTYYPYLQITYGDENTEELV